MCQVFISGCHIVYPFFRCMPLVILPTRYSARVFSVMTRFFSRKLNHADLRKQ